MKDIKEIKLFIFGEDHNNAIARKKIEDDIVLINPEIIAHELLYEDYCATSTDIKARLDNSKIGNLCDPRLNMDIYELGLRLNTKLIGIDLEATFEPSLINSFRLREDHMLGMITRIYELLADNEKAVIVVGNAHLRTEKSIELGRASPIFTYFSHKNDVKICH